MRFAADRMLGKLAKWLRILGYDTAYSNNLCDEEFLALAEKGRTLLTRNRSLLGRLGEDRLLFLEENNSKAQLLEVVRKLGLKPEPRSFFTRCTICNDALKPIQLNRVVGRVPEYVRAGHNRFSECKTCGKIYWPGSHLQNSRLEITRLLGV